MKIVSVPRNGVICSLKNIIIGSPECHKCEFCKEKSIKAGWIDCVAQKEKIREDRIIEALELLHDAFFTNNQYRVLDKCKKIINSLKSETNEKS